MQTLDLLDLIIRYDNEIFTRVLLDKYDEDRITIQSKDSSEEDNHQLLDIKDELAGVTYKCST